MITKEELEAKADAYIGHPYELDEGASVSLRREAYIDGYNQATERARKFVGDLMLWANISDDEIYKMLVEFDKYMIG